MRASRLTTCKSFSKRLLLSFALLLLCASGSALAQNDSGINLTVTPYYDGNVVQDTWLPLRVTLQNSGSDRRVRVEAASGEGGPLYGQDVDLPGGGSKDVTLYTFPNGKSETLDIIVREGDQELRRAAAKIRVRVGERMVAVVANEAIQLLLPQREELQTLPFLPFDLAPAQLPDRAAGLSSLSTVILHEVDTNSLSASQRQALLVWVAKGGQLVLSSGVASVPPLADPLEALQPAQTSGQTSLAGDALSAFTGYTETVPSGLEGVQLTPQGSSQVLAGGTTPLVVERPFGQGRVQQLAFAANAPALASWPGTARLWDKLLRPRDPNSAVTGSPGARLEDAREQVLTSSIGNLPALDLPSAVPLLALLLVYFIIIGPLMYIFLRRLGRQNWGWGIIPATTLLFGAVTYGFGFAFRASDVVMNQLSIVESLGSTANVRTFVGVYGANPESYQVAFPGDTLLRPLRSASGPYGEVDGSPGVYGQGADATAAIEASAWKVQGLQAEAQLPLSPIDSEINIAGNAITVRVANPFDQPLHEVAVRYGQQVVFLGDIPPGQQAQSNWLDPKAVEADGLPSSGDTLGVILFREALEAGRQPGAIPDRTAILRQSMVDSVLSNGALPQLAGPTLVAWLDTSPLPATVTGGGSIVTGRTTLVLARPAIRVQSGPVQLGRGWLALDYTSDIPSVCSGADGSVGVPASTSPMSLTLSLPPELGPLQASKLTLTFNSVRQWPNAGIQTALYNWATGEWDEQSFDGPGDLLVDQPEQYLRGGRVIAQFSGRIVEANCISARGTVEGTMP